MLYGNNQCTKKVCRIKRLPLIISAIILLLFISWSIYRIRAMVPEQLKFL